ncbi:cold-regulated 413 inner membrane protein 2, chloroplastic-like [Phalaenopsis equestris]|uniref:cold-regulated 413 inner membrane protein 2, chloroplastic-like n=1 Tax=Phalaenopsis equestris TaxID=78828 RepID=UPI0009E63784|nr:cold-regulated 413 inner membrane protein 2, chloroplastic-like [Phalaenopsis equestris]
MAILRSHLIASALIPHNAYGAHAGSLRRSVHFSCDTSSLRFGWQTSLFRRQKHYRGNTCYAYSIFSPDTLQWASSISSAVLMFSKGTAIQKSFLVPLFALQAPPAVILWIKGRYGIWTAFLALLVRLFYLIPGELELPFLTMLLVISAPYEAINLRGSQAGTIISLATVIYLAFQHFSRSGSLQKAFDRVSFIATLAIICLVLVSCLLLF